jgi:hypothetical protein
MMKFSEFMNRKSFKITLGHKQKGKRDERDDVYVVVARGRMNSSKPQREGHLHHFYKDTGT